SAVTFAPTVPLVRFGHFGGRSWVPKRLRNPRCAVALGGTIRMGHRTMAGRGIARRPALAAALVGLVLAGAGLVPAIAADQGSGDGSAGKSSAAKAGPARAARKKVADTADRLV